MARYELTEEELDRIMEYALRLRTRLMMLSNFHIHDTDEWQRAHDEINLVKEVRRLREEASQRSLLPIMQKDCTEGGSEA
jgi:hypothetical protein